MDQLKRRKKMIKKYKTQKHGKARVLFVKVFMVMMLCCAYVVCALLLLYSQKMRLYQYMTQIGSDSLITSKLQVAYDLNLLYSLDPNFPMTNGSVGDNAYQSLLNITDHDLSEFYVYTVNQNNDFTQNYKQVFFGDACSYYGVDVDNCQLSQNKSLTTVTLITKNNKTLINLTVQGILNNEVQIFKFLMNMYLQLSKKSNITSSNISLEAINAANDMNTYTDQIIWQFLDYEIQFLGDDLATSITISTVILAIYIVLVCLLLLVYWLPAISRKNNEVWRTTRMINMIPADVVQKIRSIRIFLRKLIRTKARGN